MQSLTTRSNVNAWLGENDATNTDNALLGRLIGQASRFIYGYLQRPSLFQHAYNDVYDGNGGRRIILRNWPVLSVGSLTVGTTSIPAAGSFGQCGYSLEPSDGMPPGRPQALDLDGHGFWRGRGNVAVAYAAGYVVQGEAWTVPGSPYQVTVIAPYGPMAVDQGVAYADGTPLVAVASGPAAGQYVPPNPLAIPATAAYTFAAADANAPVLISYSYIPSDIEQACIEIVAERFEYSSRVGQVSKSLGGQETVSYSQKDMQDYVKDLLQPYRKVIMV